MIIYENLSQIKNDSPNVIIERKANPDNPNQQIINLGDRKIDTTEDDYSQSLFKPSTSVLSLGIGVARTIKVWMKKNIQFLFPDYEIQDLPYILSRNNKNLQLANQIL